MDLKDYELGERLYHSATTKVFRGTWKKNKTPVVIKVLGENHPATARVSSFHREYDILRVFSKKGVSSIVKPIDVFFEKQIWIMVMEDFGGISLSDSGLMGSVDPISLVKTALLLTDIIDQVHKAGIIHCDINPSNILVNMDTGEIKLIDFSISAFSSSMTAAFNHPNSLEGTLAYISPEQTGRVNRSVDFRSDFYGLGATLYELATGHKPFSGKDSLKLVYSHIALDPPAPVEKDPNIPGMASDIILKLMAKEGKDRYQSAHGLRSDLQACLGALDGGALKSGFVLGMNDRSSGLQLSSTLYGRNRQIARLLESYQKVVEGERVMASISGVPGSGKTSLVGELFKPVTRDKGWFLSGKFDQLERNFPHSAFIQALEGFVDQVLAQDQAVVDKWKVSLGEVLDGLGRVITDTLPSFEKIIGPQPELPHLDELAASHRFLFAWGRVFQQIATRDHPLVLFLDDLQWADPGSLSLLEYLVRDRELCFFFPVCSFRSSTMGSAHPYMKMMETAPGRIVHIMVGNLEPEQTRQFLRDSLGKGTDIDFLGQHIQEKTLGNPFFIRRFLWSLEQEGVLSFDRKASCWKWDISGLKKIAATDNVMDLLVDSLDALGLSALETLTIASCIGNRFSLDLLAGVTGKKQRKLQEELGSCLEKHILGFVPGFVYEFVHDRIRQAIYEQLVPEQKASVHYDLGRYLMDNLSPGEVNTRLFEITDHLLLGSSCITGQKQKLQLLDLAMKAGTQAKASGVFARGFEYFTQAISLFREKLWSISHPLALEVYTQGAMAAGLCGKLEQMEKFSAAVDENAKTPLERVRVYGARIQAQNARVNHATAVEQALEILELLNAGLPEQGSEQAFMSGLQETMALVELMDSDDLFAKGQHPGPEHRAVMEIINQVSDAAYHSRPDLLPLMVFKQVRISLNHGICPESSMAFALFGLILCGVVGDIPTGVRFGRMALKILEDPKAKGTGAKTLMVVHNCVMHWKHQNREGLEHFLYAHHLGLETGDIAFAALNIHAYCYNALFTAMPLPKLREKMEEYQVMMIDAGQVTALNFHECYFQTVENLLGKSPLPERLEGKIFNARERLAPLKQAGDRTAVFVVGFCQLFLGVFFEDDQVVAENLALAKEYQDGATALIHIPMLNFFDSLVLLDSLKKEDQEDGILEKVMENQVQLKIWAEHSPSNHYHRYLLIQAGYSQAMSDIQGAQTLYAKAVAAVTANGYLHEQFLIRERRAWFFLETGDFGQGIKELNTIYHIVQQWGAEAVLSRLRKKYFQYISQGVEGLGAKGEHTTTASGAFMDTQSMLQASQALSGEVRLDRLLEKMTKIMIQNAGATRGFFIESIEDKYCMQASFSDGAVSHILSATPLAEITDFPRSILNFVVQSGKPLILDSILEDSRFSNDPVAAGGGDRSVLCLPLVHKGSLLAVIYLENNLARAVFTFNHLEVIKLLAGQVAISFENAKLYNTLEHKVKTRTRELADANRKLHHLASTDPLTGIANRRAFDKALGREWKRMERDQAPLSLILCDIDFFKKYNDAYGHQKGDDCLAAVAQVFQKALNRPGDLAARYGGEEFGVILPRTREDGAWEVAQKILNLVRGLCIPHKDSKAGNHVTISLGISTIVPEKALSPDDLIKGADQSLYQAKALGRDRAALG